jgi:glycosyltransferase involved in cell wall biosynthesis
MAGLFFSVIIPIYNGAADLPELLAALQAQTYPADRVEFLLVDNNSQDQTWALLQTAAQAWPALVPLQEAEIQSSYAARNRGIRQAKGEMLVFTDADCRPRPDWLAKLAEAIEATPTSVDLIAGEVVGMDGPSLLERHASYAGVLSQINTLNHSHCPYGQTANLTIRRSLLAKVGLFRPYLTTGGDADICWRIQRETDVKIEFAPEAIVEHRHRSTWSELRQQWQRYGRSNSYLHQLHGVELMTDDRLKLPYITYLLLRWLLRESPRDLGRILQQKQPAVSLLNTPIGLYCNWFRFQGQQAAVLSNAAIQIEQL